MPRNEVRGIAAPTRKGDHNAHSDGRDRTPDALHLRCIRPDAQEGGLP